MMSEALQENEVLAQRLRWHQSEVQRLMQINQILEQDLSDSDALSSRASVLESQVLHLSMELQFARRKPLKMLNEKLQFKFLRALVKAIKPLSLRMANRFARSASKRNPRRDDFVVQNSRLNPEVSKSVSLDKFFPVDLILADLGEFEPLAVAGLSELREKWPIVSSLPTREGLNLVWQKFFQSMPSNVEHIVFVPCLVRGGADLVAVNCLKAALESLDGNSVIIATDEKERTSLDWLPQGAQFRALSDYGDLSFEDRIHIVWHLIFALHPKSVLNINSRVFWEATVRHGRSINNYTKVFAHLFCRDYRRDGRAFGYSDTHFRESLPWLTGVFFDNAPFLHEMVNDFLVPTSLASRFSVVRQPFTITPNSNVSVVDGTPKILWAGRFVYQKNIELLIAIAGILPQFEFEIYGSGDKDYEELIKACSARLLNVKLKGVFASYQEIDSGIYSAFLFTSRFEGLPTILISAGGSGLPIVATRVGGVSDLIDENTGWPIESLTDPAPYAQALFEAVFDRKKCQEKAVLLHDRIMERHSWKSFVGSLTDSGFLPRGEEDAC